jgi:PAS domain S-box-containing protein
MHDTLRRLEALETLELLDTPAEPIFDDIALLAKRLCQTPIALISFVAGERQWFKARIGFGQSETPINQSVCIHALASDAILIIPDLSADPRTRDNPLVTGPAHLRFYAGAVIKTPGGVPIGSLCVIDVEPRPAGLEDEQAKLLCALSHQIQLALMQRRALSARPDALLEERERAARANAAVTQLRALEARHDSAQQAGGVGTFEVDVASDRCWLSLQARRLFGLPETGAMTMADIHNIVHEDDLRYATSKESRMDGTAAREIEFRIRRPRDGAIRWLNRRADFRTDASGHIVSMVGVVQDVTERKQVDLRGAALIALTDAMREADSVHNVVVVASRILGRTLTAARAGFAMLAPGDDTLTIEGDWTAPQVTSLAGRYVGRYKRTIDLLRQDAPLVIANVAAYTWLGGDRDLYEAAEARALVAVPLRDRKHLVGFVFVHSQEARTWTSAETSFVLSVADRAYAVIAKIQAEALQRVLNEELSHRLKNSLALVQSIVHQTLRGIDAKEAVAALEGRIHALGRAHDVLLHESWASADIATVVAQAIALHQKDRFVTSGPEVSLGPKATLSLSMLLHELATNATKYGALSVPDGRVEIGWSLETLADPILQISWVERGGPAASAPQRRGFGSRLLQMGISGAGRSVLDYTPEGLRATFEAPLSRISEA